MVLSGRYLRSPRLALAGVRHAIWAKRQQPAMRRLAGRGAGALSGALRRLGYELTEELRDPR